MSSSDKEQILVVKRTNLFDQQDAWYGINNKNIESMITTITRDQEYIERSIAETDYSYKQIIPYMIFTFQQTYFVMQRKATASEQRLAGKLSVGIGGHIRQEDMAGKTIFDWAQREFEEEVSYVGTLKIKTLGMLNDDTNDVGKVHLGLVLLLEGDNNQIFIKDEHKSGMLLTKEECLHKFDEMENWSKLILEILP
jgi:predicted NUDIX family phosphoesterase